MGKNSKTIIDCVHEFKCLIQLHRSCKQQHIKHKTNDRYNLKENSIHHSLNDILLPSTSSVFRYTFRSTLLHLFEENRHKSHH